MSKMIGSPAAMMEMVKNVGSKLDDKLNLERLKRVNY